MHHPLNVLVYLRESDMRYRQRLIDSDSVRYTFCKSENEVRKALVDADIILGSISFPAHLLSLAKHLRWIQVTGAGVDAFLAKQSLPDGVLLTRADVSFGDQIGEYVIGHLLSLTQRLRDVHHHQAKRAWHPLEVEFLKGRTMGIAGTGSIGQAIAVRAQAMGMRLLGFANTSREIQGFESVYGSAHLALFLSQLDALVICLPLTEHTRGLLGSEELAMLKESAILVNVARGAIVDEAALIDALQHQRLGGAILDVFEREPLPAESPLWGLENVTVTSHHSGLNIPDDIITFFLENFARFQSGDSMNGLVDVARGY